MQLPALKAEHDYHLCDDPDCNRFPCRIYKEGWDDGHAVGSASGYTAGFAEGYSQGCADTASE
jgi:hypothetical protein